MKWGNNIHIDMERGHMTMFKQILAGLEAIDTNVVFFAEHDVLYHPSHFDFIPPQKDVFYYNQNVWKVDADTGKALHYLCNQTSGLCAYRDLLVDHYRRRIEYIEANDPNIRKVGFEPGTHNRIPELAGKYESWKSEFPNIDIRHNSNLTRTRWDKSQFRNKRFTEGWTTSESVPGWGDTHGRFDAVLEAV